MNIVYSLTFPIFLIHNASWCSSYLTYWLNRKELFANCFYFIPNEEKLIFVLGEPLV